MSDRSFSASGESSDPQVIAEEIETTRAEMTETIDAIQGRLDPELIADQAVGAATEVTVQARDAAKEVVGYAIDEAKTAVRELAGQAKDVVRDSTVGRVEQIAGQARMTAQSSGGDMFTIIRQNPIPAALIAAGIGWLWMERSGGSSSQHYHYGGTGYGRPGASHGGVMGSAGQMMGQAQQMASHQAQHVASQAQQVAGQAQHMAGDLAGQAQQTAGQFLGQAQNTAGQVQDMTRATVSGISAEPLVIGTVGAVLGAVAALLLPETEQEHQLMGDAKAQLVERAQEAAGQTVEKVQRVATEVADTAVREAKAQGIAPETSGATSSA
jgi:hypothetical protein